MNTQEQFVRNVDEIVICALKNNIFNRISKDPLKISHYISRDNSNKHRIQVKKTING